jgi:hypothetical protein
MPELVWVRFHLIEPLSAVRTIRGQTDIGGNTLVWTANEDIAVLSKLFIELGGLITIDVQWDWLTDTKGLVVSSSTATLRGIKAPRLGGILRTWIQVEPG